jgi:DNA-directed RNA polymerase II subunit RPB1
MESSGSKGKMINLTQMIGLVGQQDFKQNRILKNFNERTLPYYFKNDDRADARGFIDRSFSKGLNLQQFIFHHLTAREGLIDQTVRTAESGYVQRKLIKSTEDFMVNYDCTVRNAVGRIQQFIYGDSGADTVKQYAYKFNMIEMSNSEMIAKYKFTKEEMKQVKNFSDKDNNDYVNLLMEMRDNLRKTQIKATLNNVTIESKYMLPININHIIVNIINDKEYKDNNVINDVEYIMNTINRILDNQNTKLLAMTKQEMTNPNSVKYKDDKIAKTALRYALFEALCPKTCIIKHKMNKKQLEKIAVDMINNFNRSIVEPGEMVGIIAAQSLGEPVTQLMLNAFHSSGIGGKGGTNIGVDRIKEVFSLSKNPKQPYMYVYLDSKNQSKKDFANKIASHIKFTTIKDLRSNIEIFYDPMPYDKDGFMEKDNVYNIFHSYQQNKQCCLNSIEGLPWLMRIEFDKEKLLSKEVTLLDIKSQFCFTWEKRYQDIKTLKRENKQLIEKVTQLAILSNTDNDDVPVIHLRFDLQNFNHLTLVNFMNMFVDDFKLKGMPNIDDIIGDKAAEERYLSFDNEDKSLEKKSEYMIITKGINMNAIRNIIGVDLNRTYCNDIITTYEVFGIEAARNLIIREIIDVLQKNGSSTNYQHVSIFGDLMTNIGTLTSIDRFGLNKLDTDPLARASFEKTVDQLVTAAIFNEVDYMKSVSSRIMAGLCIKGGTGICNLVLDKDLLENSEYTTDSSQLYNKTYEDITVNTNKQEIDTDVFVPDITF